MSSTKIVIIVLVLVGVLFIIFVATGALRNDPKPNPNMNTAAKEQQSPPDWTKTVKGLFSSLQPKALEEKVYSSNTTETIPASKKAFRTATFHLLSGSADISYKDETPLDSDNPLRKMDNPQHFTLPQEDPDVRDKYRGSILVLKRGGKLTFACKKDTACQVKVE